MHQSWQPKLEARLLLKHNLPILSSYMQQRCRLSAVQMEHIMTRQDPAEVEQEAATVNYLAPVILGSDRSVGRPSSFTLTRFDDAGE